MFCFNIHDEATFMKEYKELSKEELKKTLLCFVSEKFLYKVAFDVFIVKLKIGVSTKRSLISHMISF